jgi:hypothetical protein
MQLLLARSASDLDGTRGILNDLSAQLRDQFQELERQGEGGRPAHQNATTALVAFLDDLSHLPGRNLTPDLLRFVAAAYASVNRHDRAAETLKRIPASLNSADFDRDTLERSTALLRARELRLSRQFSDAHAAIESVLATGWGKRSLELRQEQSALLEDEGNFASAMRGWNSLMTQLRPQIDRNPKLRDAYFECYYHLTYSAYRHATSMSQPEKKGEGVRRAAGLIVKLETARPDMGGVALKERYAELLRKEDALRREYEQLKQLQP